MNAFGNGSQAARDPVAIIDIGSNSVRLVVYEAPSRAPTPVFNEKILCGLGRNLATTGRLSTDAMDQAIRALARFRVLCEAMDVTRCHVVATAAARDAANGPEFLARAEAASGQPIELISGQREAELSAYGVISGLYDPDGVVGDLGGGSLELIDVKGGAPGRGLSFPLGVLALQDASKGSVRAAQKIVRDMLDGAELKGLRNRSFYAVGGTWRALARLHMGQRGYPLHIMHGYSMQPRDIADFAQIVERIDAGSLEAIESVSEARRDLLAYGAVVLEEVIRRGRPREIVVSALGVREGLLFERLEAETRRQDPLLSIAAEMNERRSRSPRHGQELIEWTGRLIAELDLDETPEERRLRHAACLMADVGWRAHPDYRAEESLNTIAHSTLTGVDHPGRAFLALTVFYRHLGLASDVVHPRLRELMGARALDRARIIGGAMRVAYLVSAAMPGILPQTPLSVAGRHLELTLPQAYAALGSERLLNRLKQLARVAGLKPRIVSRG